MRASTSVFGLLIAVLPSVLFSGTAATASAQTAASRNKEGNRLFQEQKYPEAEQAYLKAQADLPDRPELSYNLGNALIKQKKYDLGLQALHQAESGGNKRLQADSWFNSGNALFEMGNFSDAAQAYAQSLRINPSDRDAKHNLELALKKMQEQPKKPGTDQDRSQQQEQDKSRQENRQSGQEAPGKSQQQESQKENKEQNRPANPKSSQADRLNGSFSKERALQILDALQNQELMEQRKQLERMVRRKVTGRDW
jgi:tetratricopeptide (TPR) repeat protein